MGFKASSTERVPWDQSKFDAVLRQYLKVCTRDLVVAINTKAFYVARGATRFTPKADKLKIQSAMLQPVILKRKNETYAYGPLAAGIINKRRGEKGQPGLQGRAMAEAMMKFMKARGRSVAFIKSGWLPAIRKLEPLADRRGAPSLDRSAKQLGRDRGSARPAVGGGGDQIVAQIINEAIARHDRTDALAKYGRKGLSQAFEDELNSMLDYIMKRLGPATNNANQQMRS